MIRLSRVCYGHPRRVLRGVSLHLPRGAVGAIIGPFGSGKTTVMRLCAGELLPSEGSVVIAGLDTQSMGSRERRRLRQATGLITCTLPLMPARTVLDSLVAPMVLRGIRRSRAVRAVFAALDTFDALHLARAAPSELSSGERQLTVVARALAHRPALVLGDEPLASLSPTQASRVMEVLADMAIGGGAILLAMTEEAHLPPHARVWRLRDGTVGPYEVVRPVSGRSSSAVLRILLGEEAS